MTQDESKLLQRLQQRKRNSLEDAIKQYTPYVSTIIYRTIGDLAPAEDMEEVIADTFFKLWIHADKICEEKGCIRAYLGAVARNTAMNKLRTIKTDLELDDTVFCANDGPQEEIMRKDTSQSLLRLILSLGEPDSEIFIRYYYYEEALKTIARRMDLNLSTVKSKLLRGKQKLKNRISKEGGLWDESTTGSAEKRIVF